MGLQAQPVDAISANIFHTVAKAPGLIDELTAIEAEFLSKVVEASSQERETLLSRYAKSAGVDDVIRLFSQMIGCANAVIGNCRLGAIDLLITKGGEPLHVAEDINLPTLAGAISCVKLAVGVEPPGGRSGCVFRHGTHFNQSPVTTEDATYPAQVCICHAKAFSAVNVADRESPLASACLETQSLREAVTRHAWTKSLPERPGNYWNWGGQPGVEADLVQVRRDSVAGCFSVREGQLGLAKAVPCSQWGGWWAPLKKPDAYSEIGEAHSVAPPDHTQR
ncbi:hypothetical protein K5D56_25510 [Pseudomonas cichorii]|nr:hypothetical protein [Pseudomonas cichorii]MBX8556991.1 hypothetical protein [Pseudomonas cichorii]MBX8592734.1 hypothetical protein [Pseudomonas cichorii]